mmetsp:Transcript_242/g.516  ORF Transcript_242/g.516 Transcript_242/m.516 type:complete len:521 (-) Transcript_242:127-1689(-)
MFFTKASFSALLALLVSNRPCSSQSIRRGTKHNEADSFEALIQRRDNAMPRACAANPQCGDLMGDCCPNTHPDGTETFLSCCFIEDSCTLNPKCNSLGLKGHCCPSLGGSNLDCCEAPTASPTASPTGIPSSSPTASPTTIPTTSPTANPTSSPTASPTATPTASPTESPTSSPTGSPTASPTASPTSNPTNSPTCPSGASAGSNPVKVADDTKCDVGAPDRLFRTENSDPKTLEECNQLCFETADCSWFSLGEDQNELGNPGFLGVCIGCKGTQPDVLQQGFNLYAVDPCTIPTTNNPTGSPTASPTSSPSSAPVTSPPTNSPSTSPSSPPTTEPSKCSAYPVCAGLGLEGDCCPTSKSVQLDCCNPAPQCALNSGCTELAGNCCPNDQGQFLSCCAEPAPEPTDPPVPSTSCGDYPVCAGLGLTGDCCPTSAGVELDCCNPEPQCDRNAACAGLSGNCCPNDQGEFLDCCSETLPPATAAPIPAPIPDASCSAHALCSGLAGDCCPTPAGVILNCCES